MALTYMTTLKTVFVSFEVVWPDKIARRILLITPLLDRGIALLERMTAQRTAARKL